MMAWIFPSEMSFAYITFHFSHIFCRPFQYLFGQYLTLHPITNLHIFLPLTMPWVLLEAKYVASWIHCFFLRQCHNWKALLFGPPLEVSTTFH
jgi:hypothetical protein